jgi:hypothetical protein
MTTPTDSPFYGQDPQTFAQNVKSSTGSDRYQVLDTGKFVRGVQLAGNVFDSEFERSGVNTKFRDTASGLAQWFTDDPNTINAVAEMGGELPGGLAALAPLAVGTVMSGGAPLYAAAGLSGIDAFTDSREGGRTVGSSAGAGALSAASVGIMPATGRFFEKFAGDTALRIAGDSVSKAALSLRQGVLNTASKFAVRETGQLATGVAFDVADVAVFDPNRTLEDLTKGEYLVPMLLSNGVTVFGQEAITYGASALRNRLTKTPPPMGAETPDQMQRRLANESRQAMLWDPTVQKLPTLEANQAQMRDVSLHGQLEQMYDNSYWQHYGSSSDIETATAHKRASYFDMSKPYQVEGPLQTTADFLNRMVVASGQKNTPMSQLLGVNQHLFEQVRSISGSDAEAYARVLKLVKDDQRVEYNQIPETLRSNPDAAKVYNIYKDKINRGQASMIYADQASGVAAILDGQELKTFKGGLQISGADLDLQMQQHGEGIRAGLTERANTLQGLRQRIQMDQGFTTGQGVDVRAAAVIKDTLKGLGIDRPIMLISDADIDDPLLSTLKSSFTQPGKYGTMIEIDDGQGPMSIIWTKGGQGNYNLVSQMHEVGHIVERHYAKQFPEAIRELKTLADREFGKKNMALLENLRQYGPAHPEFLRKAHKSVWTMKYEFPEYFSNQFSKWVLDPTAKPAGVMDKYFKGVVDGLRNVWEKMKALFVKPQLDFKTWMDRMARNFYSNLMWNDDAVFRQLATNYQLGDSGTDSLGAALYHNADPRFHGLLSDRLAKWHVNGRAGKPEAIIAQAQKDFEKIKDLPVELPQQARQVTAPQVEKLVFNPAEHFDRAAIDRFQKIFKQANDENYSLDATEAGSMMRSLMMRWTVGELPGQEGRPKFGGTKLLEDKIKKELTLMGKEMPDVMTLKANGEIDTGGEKIRYFSDISEAEKLIDGYSTMPAYEMYQIEAQSVMKGSERMWKLAFKYSPEARKVSFDERYHNAEMDNDVASVVDSAQTWSIDELLMALPEVLGNGVDNINHGLPRNTAMDLANVGVYTPKDFSGRMGQAIARSIGERTAPEPLLRALDKVVDESTKNPEFRNDLRSIGKDIGYTGDNLDGFLSTFVENITNGKSMKEVGMLAPEPLATALREIGSFVDSTGRVVEYGARVGSLLGLHEQSLEQLKGARVRGLELTTDDVATSQLAQIISESSSGGGDRMQKMAQGASWMRKAYEATINGFIHMAATNPMLAPFAEATSMEKRDQFRMTNDTMIPLHAKDPNSLKPVFEKDRAYVKVKEDPKTNALFDEMVRHEQAMGMGVRELLAAKDPELQRIISEVPQDKLGAFMELRERMYKVQEHNVQLRAQETRQLDRINLSTFLVRQVPEMNPKQAMAFVDTIYNANPASAAKIIEQSGMDPAIGKRLLDFKQQLDSTTTEMIQRLQSAPWYVSEQRMDKFLVRYYDKESKKTGAVSFKSREDADAWMQANKGQITSQRGIEDTSLKYGTRATGDFREVLDSTIKSKQAAIMGMFGDDPELVKSFNGVLDDLFQSVDAASVAATKGTLGINRKFGAGRETLDMLDQQRESIRRATVGLTRARTDALYNLHSMDQFFQTPEGARQLALAQQHKKNFREPDTEAGNAAAKFSFMWTLGTNASSMIQEVASLPLVLAPMAREHGAGFTESFSLPKKIATELAKTYFGEKGTFDNPEWNQIVLRATKENALTARHLVDIDEQHVLNDVGARRVIDGSKTAQAVGSVAEWMYKIGTKLYQPAATVSGTVSILTGFELSKKQHPNRTFDQHYAAAINFHELSQGAHGKAGRPVGMFSTAGSARTLSQVAFTLQSFANAQIGNLVRWGKKGFIDDGAFTPTERKQARAAFNQAMVLTLGTVGLTGLPLVGAISKLMEKSFGVNPEHELEKFMMEYLPGDDAENAFMTNMALRGSTYSMGLPFDLQSRLTVGGLFALNTYDGLNWGNTFGVPGSFAQEAMEALGGFVKGQGAAEAVDMVPAGLRRAVQLWVDQGKFVKNGQVLLEPSAMEKAFAVMGFTPARLKRGYDMESAKDYFTKKESKERNVAADRAVDLMNAGRMQEAQAYINQKSMELIGMRTPEDSKTLLTNEAARRYANLKTPTARDPGNTSQAPMLNAVYGGGQQVSETQRYLTEMQAKLLLGARPSFSPQRMQMARRTDQLQTMDPNLSPMLAKTYARMEAAGIWSSPYLGD